MLYNILSGSHIHSGVIIFLASRFPAIFCGLPGPLAPLCVFVWGISAQTEPNFMLCLEQDMPAVDELEVLIRVNVGVHQQL